MPFQSVPIGPDPLRVDAGAPGKFVEFAEILDADQTMFVRVAPSGQFGGPVTSPPPGFRLRANNGLPVIIAEAPDSVDIATDQRRPVASASWIAEDGGTYLLVVTVHEPGRNWELEITNNHDEPGIFTWTVADSDAEARQPWLDLAASLDFGTVDLRSRVGRATDATNLGSAPLIIDDIVADGSLFEAGPGGVIVDPHSFATIEIAVPEWNDNPIDNDVYTGDVQVWSNATNNRSGAFYTIRCVAKVVATWWV